MLSRGAGLVLVALHDERGDRAEVLERLLYFKAKNVVFAGITDRPATDACYKAGVGATIPLSIGATLDPLGSKPVKATAKVIFLKYLQSWDCLN